MTSFVNIQYPAEHPGVVRFEAALGTARQLRSGFDSSKGLATLLLAAVVAAMVVVADQLVESWADGQLLVVWVALWAVAFSAMALFAGTARQLAARVVAALDAWSRTVAQARADIRMWEAAKSDPRVMADLRVAMARQEFVAEAGALAPTTQAVASDASAAPQQRAMELGSRVLRAYPNYYV